MDLVKLLSGFYSSLFFRARVISIHVFPFQFSSRISKIVGQLSFEAFGQNFTAEVASKVYFNSSFEIGLVNEKRINCNSYE